MRLRVDEEEGDTLAVEVHQTGTNSSDVVFGARVNISTPSAPGIVINEVLPQNGGGFVEFYNPTGADIDIGGWYLSDSVSNLTKYRIPGTLSVPASESASPLAARYTWWLAAHLPGRNIRSASGSTPGALSGGTGDEAKAYCRPGIQ